MYQSEYRDIRKLTGRSLGADSSGRREERLRREWAQVTLMSSGGLYLLEETIEGCCHGRKSAAQDRVAGFGR